MQLCQSCHNEVPERGIYCPWCGTQSKCKACGDILDSNARFCASCGTAIGEGNLISAESTGREFSRNIIEFNEDRESRHFRADFSDAAIGSVSHPLAIFLGVRLRSPLGQGQQQSHQLDDFVDRGIDHNVLTANDPYPVAEEVKSLPANSELDLLKQIFRRTSDKQLRLNDSRLKQTSQIDFVKRLTVLFLYINELEGEGAIPRSDLTAILSDAKIYDSNARSFLANTDLVDLHNELVSLTLPGREEARKALDQYRDPQVKGTWTYESKLQRRTTKGQTKETGESESVRKGRVARATSYTAQVRALLGKDFFADGRTTKEVQAELRRAGHNFEAKRISEALLKLTKEGSLTRDKGPNKTWIYQNSN